MQWYSRDELHRIQRSNLQRLLVHCSTHIPYYSDLAKKVEYKSQSDPYDELKKFPFLDKKTIKQNLADGLVDKSRKLYFIDRTSGSSGIQGDFYSDKSAYSKTIAIQSLWWEWAGYRFGDRLFQTGMTLRRGFVKGIKDLLLRVKYTSAFQLNAGVIENKLRSLKGKNGYFFAGYASSLYAYAKFARERGVDDVRFRGVISWGDKMFPHYRKCIEEQFDTKVFDDYGAAEGTMIAAECEHHNYHIMSPHVHIEILNKDGNEVSPGEIGEVVVTRLDNFYMPLLRYRIGDLAVKADPEKSCPCGRHLPLLEKIIGRDTDLVYTPKKKMLIVHFFTAIFELLKEIEQFQVVQYSLEDVEIRFIPSVYFVPECLESIKKEIWEKAEEEFDLRFTKVDKIDDSRSGKPQIVVSELPYGSY
jgi:phenylacetate-CoA ligase